MANYLAHRDELDGAIARVLSKGRFILGEEVGAFENEFSQYIGVRFGVGVGSGTEALHLALRCCGIGPGDEVITVSHTAVATVSAIELCGATPVVVDIDPATYTLDPDQIEPALTPRVKAIIPVHLYGHPADMESIMALARRHGLWVIEDCAQSHGAVFSGKKAGAWGDISAFSFYPTKNLGAFGDGGMVVTNNEDLAGQARLLREYGWAHRYVSDVAGWNTRLDELQAAVLRAKLRHLDGENEKRRDLAALYDDLLSTTSLCLPRSRSNSFHVYHQYVVRASRRDELREYLRTLGMNTLIHYPVPVHLQPAYVGRLTSRPSLYYTEKIASEIVSLPMFPELPLEDVRKVALAIMDWDQSGRE